jgi:mannose-6-phosphate isomerase-like protein (cupin superfamily)
LPRVLHLPSLPRAPTVAHDGVGRIEVARPLIDGDFETDLVFVEYVEVPPQTSIGLHRHGDDEEIYVLIHGRGTMTIEGERHPVASGDLILNRRNWTHGLENDSSEPIRMIVWQTRYRAEV